MSKIQDYKELIRELAELLDKSTLSEIEVEEDDFRIRVAREVASSVTYTTPAQTQIQPPATVPAIHPQPAVAESASQQAPTKEEGVPSPMVGTIYSAPSPGSDPFIKVGDAVQKGDTIAIIEAMKVMNQIASPVSGTVKEIYFQDGQPVEYGEALCRIE